MTSDQEETYITSDLPNIADTDKEYIWVGSRQGHWKLVRNPDYSDDAEGSE